MKSFKQILNENIFFQNDDLEPINLDEHLDGFIKTLDEENGITGYVNEKLSVPIKHEHLHQWVMSSGYVYENKSFKPQIVTEHLYSKIGLKETHHLLVITRGDQGDVWQVKHQTLPV